MATPKKKRKISRDQLGPGDCLCDYCTAKCCRYFSLPIHNPATWDDFDTIRWYLAHGQTAIYVEKRQWYLLVYTRCNYLTENDRCGIYLNRPRICSEYTTDNCEYDSEWSFEKLFETPEQIWEYAEAVLPPRRKPRRPALNLPVVTISSSEDKGKDGPAL
jgi:Fe-S-cluster containining protein